MSITENQLESIELSDEYDIRHHWDSVFELAKSYRELVYLLDVSGVLHLQDDWAKKIQEHVEGIEGEEP